MKQYMDKRKRTHIVRQSIARVIMSTNATLKETEVNEIDDHERMWRDDIKRLLDDLKELTDQYDTKREYELLATQIKRFMDNQGHKVGPMLRRDLNNVRSQLKEEVFSKK